MHLGLLPLRLPTKLLYAFIMSSMHDTPFPHVQQHIIIFGLKPLKAELHPICHLLALLAAHHILHVSRIRVESELWPQPANT